MKRPTFDDAIHRAPIREESNPGVFVFWALLVSAATAFGFAAWWAL